MYIYSLLMIFSIITTTEKELLNIKQMSAVLFGSRKVFIHASRIYQDMSNQ